MGPPGRTVEREIARIADRRHGLAARRQLLAAGVSVKEIRRRLEKGALFREFPGVYRVGHRAPSVDARYMAAVLACGDGARLTGRAAAHLHRLIKGAAPPPEVIAPTERKIRGIKTRRSRRLDPRDVKKVRGIPVTTVVVTLVELAAELDEDDLARVCHEAGVLYRVTPAHVKAVLKRRPKAKGANKLMRIMEGKVPVSLRRLESLFIARLRQANLPIPETNKPVGSKRVDCRWPDHELTVELVSYQFHNSRYAWEQDLERERQAYDRDDRFRRYSWKD